MRFSGTLCSLFSLSIIILSSVDFPQRRTPVSIFTNGVSTYAMILSAYIGLSIICNTSIAIIILLCRKKNQHFCGYKSQKCSTRIILADYVRLFAAFFCCFSFFMQCFFDLTHSKFPIRFINPSTFHQAGTARYLYTAHPFHHATE